RHVLTLAALGLCVSASGCAASHRARADVHHERAKSEAKDLNLGKAVKEEGKAHDARKDAAKSRF
ncbi:MAG TPA: hypothetical protein VMZ28_03185, partial [Kofleriaceae bacterium]|nr:hypothetical protein [Kofleriaceae bacterium]